MILENDGNIIPQIKDLIDKAANIKNRWEQHHLKLTGEIEQKREGNKFFCEKLDTVFYDYMFWHGECLSILKNCSQALETAFSQDKKEFIKCFEEPTKNYTKFLDLIDNKVSILSTCQVDINKKFFTEEEKEKRLMKFIHELKKPTSITRWKLILAIIAIVIAFVSLILTFQAYLRNS